MESLVERDNNGESIDFMGVNFYSSLKELNELYIKREAISRKIKDSVKQINDVETLRDAFAKNGKHIIEEISTLISEKKELYDNLDSFDTKTIDKINHNLGELLRKKEHIDAEIMHANSVRKIALNCKEDNIKRLENINNRIKEVKEKILKICQSIEPNKITKPIITSREFSLSEISSSVKNDNLKERLLKITRANYEIYEKLVYMIYKCSNRILNRDEAIFVEEIILLYNIKSRISLLINNLISVKNINSENIEALDLLIKLMDKILDFSNNILDNRYDKIKMSDVVTIKDASQLNNKNVLRKYRLAFLHKEKLDAYSTSYIALYDVISFTLKYLESTDSLGCKQKVYSKN